jgi:predicted O-linked N-acetylglucosamine transferase (SPINDLY family)
MSEPLLTSAVRAHKAGDLAQAARLYAEILSLEPRQFMALYGLGILHYQSGRYENAELLMAEAIRCNPSASDCFFTRGYALQRLNRPAEALICFDHVLTLKPDSADAYSNRGVVLMTLNRNAEALESFRKALGLNPSNPATWNNRGCVLVNLRRYDEAIPCFDNALAREPRFAQALINRGSANASLEHYSAAIVDFERALEIEPDFPYAAGNLALYRMQCSDWVHFAQDKTVIGDGIRAGKRTVLPFIHLAISGAPAEQLRCASIFTANDVLQPAPLWRDEKYHHDKIRIAYVSADFHSHATAALMAGVFEQHDRSAFETIAISFGRDDESPMRKRVTNAFDRFIDVREKSDFEIATLMRQLEIDIAVDLKGYTKDNRAGIFAHRPCPVQASYLGYPGTMAAPFIDYLIADPIVVPDEAGESYRECIVWLPDSYQCNTPRTISGDAKTRADRGLPEEAFVFCCFNNSFKINPEMFTVWMRLLRTVRGSVLWLIEDNPESRDNLRREAEARGIAGDRLVFAGRVPLDEHLARHRHADLFLDTQPYGAHTTASDALWAGVPVLTVAGPSFAARVAAGLLHAAGMPELVAPDLAAYEATALRLAGEPESLAAIRTRLTVNREHSPLFDTAKFTRNLEAAYTIMAERSRRGEPPVSFDLGDRERTPQSAPAVPDAAAAAFLQGCKLVLENDLAGALPWFDEAISGAPDFVEALVNRGAVLVALDRPADAIGALDHAVAVNPSIAEGWNNRGNALSALGRYDEAVASFDHVLGLHPRLLEALINRGTALLALRRTEDALASYDAALQVNPGNAAALQGRANALFELKRFDESIRGFEAVVTAEPSQDVAGILAFSRLQCCDWRMLEQDRALLSGINLSQAGCSVDPFQYLAISSSAGDQRRCAEIWTALKHPPGLAHLWTGEDYRHERIRIAWLSADFRNHPVAQNLTAVWERLDRTRFESIGVGWGAPDNSEIRARALRSFDEFISVEDTNDRDVARLMRDREIDIAVDLMGFTAECRPGILAARPAPVQAAFLGFAGTMGALYLDFLIADAVAIPGDERPNFSETVLHLPSSFFPVDASRPIAPAPSRSEAGLPETGFVFACFNNTYKYTPELFDIWMRLLRNVSDSVLWLSVGNAAASRNLRREAELRHVDPARLIFAPYISEPERHLARLGLAQLFLDTLPYNAHATAADALLAGLPVLTCRGKTFAGRVAASLLCAAGLPELVTDDLAAYEEIALGLARDSEAVHAIKVKLAEARHAQPLFDTAAYTRNIEAICAGIRKREDQTGPRLSF